MSLWSEHFENRDPVLRPWDGDEWSDGKRVWRIVGALFDKNHQPVLVVFDDSSIGRSACAGGTWKRMIKNFKCVIRMEDKLTPKTIAELKAMESTPGMF